MSFLLGVLVSLSATQLALQKLAGSGLDARDAKLLGLEPLTAAETARLFPKAKVASLLIPYYTAQGRRRKDVCRARLLEFPPGPFGATPEKPLRYLQPEGSPPAAYFPRTVDWKAVFADPGVTIVLTEGELKAACACKHGFKCIGLGGVSSWRSAKQGWSLLPELAEVPWAGRDVVTAFDSDAATNPNVAAALAAMVAELSRRGARPAVAQLPAVPGLSKTGLDDLVVALGVEELRTALAAAAADELAAALWEFNGRFAFVLDPGFVYQPDSNTRYAGGKFKTEAYANVWATEQRLSDSGAPKLVRTQVAHAWIDWPLRRQYRRLTYLPGQPAVTADELNTWGGWACEAKRGDVKPWTELLDYLFEGAEPEARAWFERWCLYPIAHPGAKLLSACGVWSRGQGLGKSLVGEILGRVYGRNYSLIGQVDLESPNNDWAVDRQFVMVDDVSSFDSRSKADLLKKLITQSTIRVNIKFIPQYYIPDCLNYYLTSNHANAFYLEDLDRRFFVHEVTTAAKPRAFYKALVQWMDSPEGPAALLAHAQAFDFGGFDPKAPPPLTQAKRDMVASGKGELDAWVADLRDDPGSKLRLGKQQLTRDLWTPSELVALFDGERKGQAVTAAALGLRLRAAGLRAANHGNTLRPDEVSERFYIVRNPAKWVDAPVDALIAHVRAERLKERGGASPKKYK